MHKLRYSRSRREWFEAGFTIVEVLVAVAIGGITMAAFMTMMSNQLSETRALSQKMTSLELEKLMLTVLSDGASCTAVMSAGFYTIDLGSLSSAVVPPSGSLPPIPVSATVGAPTLVASNMDMGNGVRVASVTITLIVADVRFHVTEPPNFSNRSHRSVSDVRFN